MAKGALRRVVAKLINKNRQPGEISYGGYGQTNAGVLVSEDVAMRFAAVQACVRVLSEDIAALPLFVYERTSDGGKTRAANHPLYDLLHNSPNPEMTAVSFKEALMVNLLLTGNGYAFIEYDNSGRVRGLWPVVSSLVTPYRDSVGAIRYQIDGKAYSADEVLHIPGLGYDGLVGLSPIAYARESIGLGMAAEQFGSEFFKNGTHLGGVITVPGTMEDKAFERTSAEFKAMYRGLQNSHGIPVLEGGATFTSIGVPPEDAQFLETRKYQRSEIAGIFRVPPHLIGDLERATFSNIEHQDISYLQRSLLPWMRRIEQVMQTRLLSGAERARYVIEHDTGSFLRGDTKSRYEAYAIGIQNGILTRNEVRVRENLNPIDGGDELLQPLNMAAVGTDAEKDAERAFRLLDVLRFTSDRARRAAISDEIAATNYVSRESAIRLEGAFRDYLISQADDIRKIAEEAEQAEDGRASRKGNGELSEVGRSYLRERLDAYYRKHSHDIPQSLDEEIRRVADEAARNAYKQMDLPYNANSMGEFVDNYVSDAAVRFNNANYGELRRQLDRADEKNTHMMLDKFIAKLDDWGGSRARRMAKYEQTAIGAHVAEKAFTDNGYFTVWKSGVNCCKICQDLNNKLVFTLHPPLHKGCTCSVALGPKKETEAVDGRRGSGYNHIG